jgi:membrane-bound hydrogenase subunit beta
MSQEEKIKEELTEKFADLKDSIVIKRERRIFVDVSIQQWAEVFDYLVKNMKFTILSTITGLDEGSAFALIYHLSRDSGLMMNLRTHILRDNPSINTVTPYFLNAEMYERELMDLLGIKVVGLAKGNRYPLPETWPQNEFPLRKDWQMQPKLTE